MDDGIFSSILEFLMIPQLAEGLGREFEEIKTAFPKKKPKPETKAKREAARRFLWESMVQEAPDRFERARRTSPRMEGTQKVYGAPLAPETSEEFLATIDYVTDPRFTSPEKGIAVGDLSGLAQNYDPAPSPFGYPGQGMRIAQDKLSRIREEAKRKFPGATGPGFFTQPEVSPEVEQRLAENQRWLENDPYREMAWQMTAREGDPQKAAVIAQALRDAAYAQMPQVQLQKLASDVAYKEAQLAAKQQQTMKPDKFVEHLANMFEFGQIPEGYEALARMAMAAAAAGRMDEAVQLYQQIFGQQQTPASQSMGSPTDLVYEGGKILG